MLSPNAGGAGSFLHPHAAHVGHRRRGSRRLRFLGHHRLGGHQQTGDRGRVLQRDAHHLGGVDDAGGDHIGEFVGLRVEAIIVVFLFEQLCRDDATIETGVLDDLAKRRAVDAEAAEVPRPLAPRAARTLREGRRQERAGPDPGTHRLPALAALS